MSSTVLDRTPSQQPNVWASMPGWGITADLTPPEVIASRRLRRLRNMIIVLLVLVLLACVAGYVWAAGQGSDAVAERARAQDDTITLQIQLNKYSTVTRVEGATGDIESTIGSLLAGDVDVAKLTASIRGALPATMSINNLTMNLSGTNRSASTTRGGSGTGLFDGNQIGTVTISGVARNLDGLPLFVDHLNTVTGIANVVPTSNQASGRSVNFTVNLVLTDALYSHHFDKKSGGTR